MQYTIHKSVFLSDTTADDVKSPKLNSIFIKLKNIFLDTKAPGEDKSARYVTPFNSYDEVYPGIILGCYKLANDFKDLKANGITHVLNCCQGKRFTQIKTDEKYYAPSNISFLGIPAMDVAGFKLEDHFTACANFIDECLASNGRVYVHCFQGMSRSATIVVAFLMLKRGMNAFEAGTTIRLKRPVLPNDGFLTQLCQLNNELYPQEENTNSESTNETLTAVENSLGENKSSDSASETSSVAEETKNSDLHSETPSAVAEDQ